MQRKWIARGVGVLVFIIAYIGFATVSEVAGIQYFGEVIAALFLAALVADEIDPVDPNESWIAETSENDPRGEDGW